MATRKYDQEGENKRYLKEKKKKKTLYKSSQEMGKRRRKIKVRARGRKKGMGRKKGGRGGKRRDECDAEALEMLPCTQDHTERPQVHSSYSFFNVSSCGLFCKQLRMPEGFAPGLQLGRVGLVLNKELQRKGGGAKKKKKIKGNSAGSSNILLLPVCTKYVNTWHPLHHLFRAKVST